MKMHKKNIFLLVIKSNLLTLDSFVFGNGFTLGIDGNCQLTVQHSDILLHTLQFCIPPVNHPLQAITIINSSVTLLAEI